LQNKTKKKYRESKLVPVVTALSGATRRISARLNAAMIYFARYTKWKQVHSESIKYDPGFESGFLD